METDSEISSTGRRQGNAQRLLVLLGLALAIGAAAFLRADQRSGELDQTPAASPVAEVTPQDPTASQIAQPKSAQLPRLLDLGATECIPCKMMAPILEELKKDFAGRLEVRFIDVRENADAGREYGVEIIPTQIFYDASGKERFRHQGFYSREDILAKWQQLGVALGAAAATPAEFSRLEPVASGAHREKASCYMCDGNINPKTRTVLKTDKGDVVFCSLHCWFIAFSSMVEAEPSPTDLSVTDWVTGASVSAASAKYVYGVDVNNRPSIKAFGDASAAAAERQAGGGNIVEWGALQTKELTTRCGFCDRAVYPEDACVVKVSGLNTWGCCPMCALGVAARLQKDIEVSAKDALTGVPIGVKTVGGHVGALDPPSAVAWAGSVKDADGKLVSTGCFKQAFFANEANLRTWVDAHPTATGRLVSIEQALAEKMKLTPQQISRACKIGECVPK